MTKYMWSPGNLSFFPTIKVEDYLTSGWDLSDIIEIEDNVAELYMQTPPDGKMRGVLDGMPAWIDVPQKPSYEMYQSELSQLSATFLSDVDVMSQQFAKAALIDGVTEQTKKTAIYNDYQVRKQQHTSDIANLKVKYGM